MSLDTYINYFWLPVIAASLGLLIYSAILTVKSWRWKFTFLHTLATIVGRRGDQRTLEVSFSAPKLARGFIITAEGRCSTRCPACQHKAWPLAVAPGVREYSHRNHVSAPKAGNGALRAILSHSRYVFVLRFITNPGIQCRPT